MIFNGGVELICLFKNYDLTKYLDLLSFKLNLAIYPQFTGSQELKCHILS